MIKIVGRIKNAVDCGCYDIEAIPAPEPELDDCACGETRLPSETDEATKRVRVNAKRSFTVDVTDSELRKWFASRTPRFNFRVYLNGEFKQIASEDFVWSARKRGRELVLDLCTTRQPRCGKVCGKVTDCRGRAIGGMPVRIFDVDLDDMPSQFPGLTAAQVEGKRTPGTLGTLLGESVTNDCGEYCICYKYAQYSANEIDTADIRVVLGTGNFRPLQVSDIQFNAPPDLTVDMLVPGAKLDGRSEFNEYDKKLTRLGCATPTKRRTLTIEKLDFISTEASIPLEHLLLLKTAYTLDKEYFQPVQALPDHLIPQALYGLLRVGATGPFPNWARAYIGSVTNDNRLGDKLTAMLDSAIDRCIIDRALGVATGKARIDLVALLIWAISFLHALAAQLLPNRSSWFDLFNLVWSDPYRLFKFGLAWIKFGVGDEMWLALGSILTPAEIDKLKTFMQLAEIADFHAPAVSLFLSNQATFLASVGSDTQWAVYFSTATVTPPPVGIPFPEYALEVLQRARVYFGTTVVETWATGVTGAAFPASLNLTTTEARRCAERISRLAMSAEFAGMLAAQGFTSARDIATLRWDDFIKRVGVAGDHVEALHVFTKARETRAVAIAATLQLSPTLNSPMPFLGTPNFTGTTIAGTAANLFGTGSQCDCEGRQSVFSPAAYLHALRRFLGGIAGVAGAPDARTQFDLRRPEVRKLKLSYVNSYTTMPTIDLNNEVLEELAAGLLDPTIPTFPNRQTTWESSELAFKPEYEIAEVYAEFLDWQLGSLRFPFDLGHAKRRFFLQAIGLPRDRILRQVSTSPATADLSEAALDLSAKQRERIEATLSASAAPAALPTPVPEVMAQVGLGFQDVYAITQLSSIYTISSAPISAPVMSPALDSGASNPATWTPPVGVCDPGLYTLRDTTGSAQGPTGQQVDRIHRFVRLWRALPWPMHLLDWAIGSFALETGDVLFPLKRLGMAELIRRRLNLQPHEVIAFWTPLSTQPWKMPFAKTKAILSPWEQVFRTASAAGLTLASAARSAGVSVAFAEKLLGSSTLSEDSASNFYRYGRLARAIPGLQPEDIARYEYLSGRGVFASPDDTWAALEELATIADSGARLSTALPLYMAPASQKTALDRVQVLAAIEDLNRRVRLPILPAGLSAPFETRLARFTVDATASVVIQKLSQYGTGNDIALDNELVELLSSPGLAAPPLSGMATDAARKTAILTELSRQGWEAEIDALLARVSGMDAKLARRVAESVETSGAVVLKTQLQGFLGDGGIWSAWPATFGAPPGAQVRFLDEGVLVVPRLAATSPLATTFDGFVIVGTPGQYAVRVTASYVPGLALGTVQVNSVTIAPGAMAFLQPFTVAESGTVAQALTFHLAANTECSITIELVDLAGNVQPLPGARLHSVIDSVSASMDALELLALTGVVGNQWNLSSTDLSALANLQAGSATFPRFPPSGTTRPLVTDDLSGFTEWLRYARIVAALKVSRGEGRRALYDTVSIAQPLGAADPMQKLGDAEVVCAGIAAALEVELKCVQDAALHLGILTVEFASATHWGPLFALSRALQEHGVKPETLAAWGSTSITASDISALESTAHAKLASSSSEAKKLRKAVDDIRILKRDVLGDFLLTNMAAPAGRQWATLKDISDYLLTDIEMAPCAEVSRTRFAIAAAQRLVTQIQANAETLWLTNDQKIEWDSISRYPLWEVRQKLLLYPENWLRFGRHLHASAEFEELERGLLQGELTEERSREAITRYVEQLHEIGHLEIVGTCTQQEFDATGAASIDLLHVVGRTPAEPRAYYHRTRVDGAYWTPWTKIEVDIDCDQVVPVVTNRQLHLFWLVADDKPQPKTEVRKDERQIALEDKYQTLRLAWSVLTSKGWHPKRISKDSLPTRFGHYAANQRAEIGTASPYVEVHAWNQAVQDIGRYLLRPALSAEGDVVIEIYAPLESTVVAKGQKGIADWAYEIRRVLGAWFNTVDAAAYSTMIGLLNGMRSSIGVGLIYAYPSIPDIVLNDTRTTTSADLRLFGKFRLTPDNLVEVRSRNTVLSDATKYLVASERAQTRARIGNAVARSGAFEFDDGSVELYVGGAYRTVLATAGVPVRVVVTRQETLPSQRDPIFCRIKNRAFFAFKDQDVLPPVRFPMVGVKDSARQVIKNPFQAVPRDYIARATATLEASPAARATAVQPAYGIALANKFAAATQTSATTTPGSGWRFALAHHPQTIELLRASRAGLDRLYKRETQADSRAATGSLTTPFDFDADYDPKSPWVDTVHLPVDQLEFKSDQAYSVANWELLCFAPLVVGDQLKRVGRYDQATDWIARVFNPRDPEVLDPVTLNVMHPEKYWVFKPFEDFVASGGVGDFADLDPNPANADPYRRKVFRALIRQWRRNPYNPHAVATFRPQAYQLASLIMCVETYIAWGDYLFAAPSAELVEEAARRYEEAERIIGRPPSSTGAIRYDTPALTLEQLDLGLSLGSTELENGFSVGEGASPHVEDEFLPDLALGYFCLPPNPKLKELREKIQDRLFKVHHCLDLLGNARKLPLYDPPIDPALLADAAMAGLNVSQAVMDAYTPRPHYRFRTLMALAKGITQHVIALGGGLLSAMEKRDAESLSLLKMTHESKLLERATAIRKLQVKDAEASIKALEATLESVQFREEFYASREFMNTEETAQIALSVASTILRIVGQALSAAGSAAGAIPDITIGAAGWAGSPVTVAMTGGANASRVPANLGLAMGMAGEVLGTASGIAGTVGSFRRRKDDWDFQAESAKREGKQINAQIVGAKIRQAIAERELANHEAQIEGSREELDFVRTKQTSVRLYEWLADDVATSYYRAFQLAHSMALQAQRALQDELALSQRYIGYSHWNSGHTGLQAGERLMQELLEMESEYHDRNARPVVKTVNVSLAETDPIALADLKVNGTCSFTLGEEFWDRRAPGLYLRRYANVALSVACVVGPFGGLHGRLSIDSAEYRRDASLPDAGTANKADDYLPQGNDDPRFVRQFARPGDSITLSTGVRDTGLGADEAREDRYRPFENLGVASSWRLDISQKDNAFDLATISDVVLHVEYTARDGGEELQAAARLAQAKRSASEGFMVSLRHQYAAAWQKLKAGDVTELDLAPPLSFAVARRDGRKVTGVDVAVILKARVQPADPSVVSVMLSPPSALLLPATNTIPAIDPFPVKFTTPVDGGSRLGIASQSLRVDVTQHFEVLRSAPWTLSSVANGIELEDAVIAVSWTLDA